MMIHGTFYQSLARLAIAAPAFLMALSFHEFAHACTALWLGDDTAKRMGRLTLNPLAHIDWFGFLCLLLFRVGWATPVQFDARNFRHPRLYAVLTACAGPFANIILALLCLFLIKGFSLLALAPALELSLHQILGATAGINIMLAVFNILPVPPLDGGHVVVALLDRRFPEVVDFLRSYGFFVLLFLIFFTPFHQVLIRMFIVVEHLLKMLVFSW